MLIKDRVLQAIVAGEVDLAFRRWEKPRVKAGTRLRTKIGVLEVVALDVVTLASISDKDAARAGFASATELVAEMKGRSGRVYRIALEFAGADPRVELRERADLDAAAVDDLLARLMRMDRAAKEPWTKEVLDLIAVHSGVRAPDLAASRGEETQFFKTRVRRLKELGLTESLKVGYRISARGRALLEHIR